MHAIRNLMLRCQHSQIRGMKEVEEYVNSPRFFIKKATEALYSAHFGPKDLRHTNLNRAAELRSKAFAASRGVIHNHIKHVSI